MNDFGMQDVFTLHIKRNPKNKVISPSCEACTKGFIHVDTLQVRNFTQTGKLPGVCQSCNTQFLKVCRDQIRAMNQPDSNMECEDCGRIFSHSGSYSKHRKLHKEAERANSLALENFKAEQERENSNQPKMGDSNLLDETPDCELLTPAKVPDQKSRFFCHICEKVFSTQSQLKNHVARCENRDSEYMCHFCEKYFSTKSGLKSHMSTHLPDAETHVCKFCKEEFLIAEELEEHLLMHLNENPKPTRPVMHLKENPKPTRPVMHLKENPKPTRPVMHLDENPKPARPVMHLDENPKPTRPVKAPTPSQQEKFNHFCAQCGKGFCHLGHLKKHMVIHGGQLPFNCVTCNKQYVRPNKLKQHMKICRKDPSILVCNVCSKEFNYLKSFKRHKLLHKAKKEV